MRTACRAGAGRRRRGDDGLAIAGTQLTRARPQLARRAHVRRIACHHDLQPRRIDGGVGAPGDREPGRRVLRRRGHDAVREHRGRVAHHSGRHPRVRLRRAGGVLRGRRPRQARAASKAAATVARTPRRLNAGTPAAPARQRCRASRTRPRPYQVRGVEHALREARVTALVQPHAVGQPGLFAGERAHVRQAAAVEQVEHGAVGELVAGHPPAAAVRATHQGDALGLGDVPALAHVASAVPALQVVLAQHRAGGDVLFGHQQAVVGGIAEQRLRYADRAGGAGVAEGAGLARDPLRARTGHLVATEAPVKLRQRRDHVLAPGILAGHVGIADQGLRSPAPCAAPTGRRAAAARRRRRPAAA